MIECDTVVVIGAIVVFALPLTLLIPNFPLWRVVPKISVVRFPIIAQECTWPQINSVILLLLLLFFCLYLEIRKRKLDDMVENVMSVCQATNTTMEVEHDRQNAAVRVCVELLDASTDHYENMVMLRDDLRKRETLKQYPPAVELSSCAL